MYPSEPKMKWVEKKECATAFSLQLDARFSHKPKIIPLVFLVQEFGMIANVLVALLCCIVILQLHGLQFDLAPGELQVQTEQRRASFFL